MIDSTYFRTRLAADLRAFEPDPIVEVHMVNGQFHRLRNVLEVQEGYVIVETYRLRTEEAIVKRDAVDEVYGGQSGQDVERAIIAYENIVQVLVMQSRAGSASRIGFGSARAG